MGEILDKQDYISYLDRLIRDTKNYNISDYEFTMRQLESDAYVDRDIIRYDVFRRKKGLEDFYGTRELQIPDKEYTSVLNLEHLKIYKGNLLYIEEVEFSPTQFEYKFTVDDKEVSYRISEDKVYMIESTEIKNNSNLFFDIKHKKLITMEGKDFAEYEED